MDERMIMVDGRKQPFFVMDNEAIDEKLSLEAVAVLAYIQRHKSANVEAVVEHFGIATHHVEIAMIELEKKAFITTSNKD